MSYTPQVWVDGSSGGTPISATRLNHMEAGIDEGANSLPQDYIDALGKVTETGIEGGPTLFDPANATYADGGWWRLLFNPATDPGTSNIDFQVGVREYADDTWAQLHLSAYENFDDAGQPGVELAFASKDGQGGVGGSLGLLAAYNRAKLRVTAASGQTVPLLDLQDEHGVTVASIGPTGVFSSLLPLGKIDPTGVNPSGILQIPTLFDPASTAWDDHGWWAMEYQPGVEQLTMLLGSHDVTADPDGAWINLGVTPTAVEITAAQYTGNGFARLSTSPTQAYLNVRAVDGQTGPLLDLLDADGDQRVHVDVTATKAEVQLSAGASDTGGFQAWHNTGAAGDFFTLVPNGSNPLLLDAVQTVLTLGHVAPTDAVINDLEMGWGTGDCAMQAWVDEGTNKLKFRVMYHDGTTFKTAEVALA